MATRRTQKLPLRTVDAAPVVARAPVRPAGEQALDAASWARLRKVIEGLSALSTPAATRPPRRR